MKLPPAASAAMLLVAFWVPHPRAADPVIKLVDVAAQAGLTLLNGYGFTAPRRARVYRQRG